jgi:hypothetical protein
VPGGVEKALGDGDALGGGHGRQRGRVGHPAVSPSICWITVGGIGPKREDLDGQLITRDYLSLTVSFDHNLVDGAPAARFTERFKELIENGYGLTLDEETSPVRNERRPQPQVV